MPNKPPEDFAGMGSWTNDQAAKGSFAAGTRTTASSPTTPTRATTTAPIAEQTQGSTDKGVMLHVFMNQGEREAPWSPVCRSN